MNTGKCKVIVGFTKKDLAHYKYNNDDLTGLVGADIEAADGLGNVIKVHVRDEDIGYRIEINGKTVAESDEDK